MIESPSKTAILALAILVSAPAAATSIMDYEEDRIINILAETMVVAARCGPSMFVDHDMRDLVADILELKVGADLNDEPHATKFYDAVERFDHDAKSGPNIFCLAALGKYGESGKMVRGLVVEK